MYVFFLPWNISFKIILMVQWFIIRQWLLFLFHAPCKFISSVSWFETQRKKANCFTAATNISVTHVTMVLRVGNEMLRWRHRFGNTLGVTNIWSSYTITPIHWPNSSWHRPPTHTYAIAACRVLFPQISKWRRKRFKGTEQPSSQHLVPY